MKKEYYFPTPIWYIEKKEWLDNLISHTDKYIDNIKNKNIELSTNNKDFGITHHSDNLQLDENFKELSKFICETSVNILNEQGYNMEIYNLIIDSLWVQEFSKKGGGYHDSHIHSNCHISGFYFLKCSDKTSYPIFYDSRLNKKMIQLKEKDSSKITESSEIINIKPTPGLFVFFNSYLDHGFTLDHGIEPFRFIHFNIQALPKQLINNNNIKLISS
jgi:uncharacterized protein (TIGR02466 family)